MIPQVIFFNRLAKTLRVVFLAHPRICSVIIAEIYLFFFNKFDFDEFSFFLMILQFYNTQSSACSDACTLSAIDPRTQDSFLLQTPEPMLFVVLAYLAFVVIAPRVMENREPFDLKKFILVYNFMLVALSGYMCFQVGAVACL